MLACIWYRSWRPADAKHTQWLHWRTTNIQKKAHWMTEYSIQANWCHHMTSNWIELIEQRLIIIQNVSTLRVVARISRSHVTVHDRHHILIRLCHSRSQTLRIALYYIKEVSSSIFNLKPEPDYQRRRTLNLGYPNQVLVSEFVAQIARNFLKFECILLTRNTSTSLPFPTHSPADAALL